MIEGDFIVMTAAQAAQVQGQDGPITALRPRDLGDGRFVLAASILNDPAHAAHHDLLAALPIQHLTAADFPPAPDV